MNGQNERELTAQERAAKVGAAIRCAIKQDGTVLRRRVYQETRADGTLCMACALGALAGSVGCRLDRVRNRNKLKEAVADSETAGSLISPEEIDQLELGFEGMPSSALLWETHPVFGPAENCSPRALANQSDPFFQLGAALAMERKL